MVTSICLILLQVHLACASLTNFRHGCAAMNGTLRVIITSISGLSGQLQLQPPQLRPPRLPQLVVLVAVQPQPQLTALPIFQTTPQLRGTTCRFIRSQSIQWQNALMVCSWTMTLKGCIGQMPALARFKVSTWLTALKAWIFKPMYLDVDQKDWQCGKIQFIGQILAPGRSSDMIWWQTPLQPRACITVG